MSVELSDKERRLINVLIVGIIILVVGLATIFTNKLEVYIPLILSGLIIVVTMIIYFIRTPRKSVKLRRERDDLVESENETEIDIEELVA